MRKRPIILKLTAVFLLSLFLTKSVGGLIVHNLYHAEQNFTKSPAKKDKSNSGLNAGCSCVDEFLQAFMAADEIQICQLTSYHGIWVACIKADPVQTSDIAYTLRGPPARML